MSAPLTEEQKQDQSTNSSQNNGKATCFEENPLGKGTTTKNPTDTIDSTSKETNVVTEPSTKEAAEKTDCITQKPGDTTDSIIIKEEVNSKEANQRSSDLQSSNQQQKIESKKLIATYPDGILKTTARINHGASNSKYDPSVLTPTDDPEKIREQIEFYFGDTNLPTDKFMWELTGGSANKPVPIKKICLFGRMRRFTSYSKIVSALKDSEFLKVSGEEGDELVERVEPYDPELKDDAERRSIYAKGFGDEESSTQFDIEAFFASYGRTNAVRLRRTPEKLFKGSVFVEFADEETAQKFLSLPSKPLWKGKFELKIMPKKEYTDLKIAEEKYSQINPTSTRQRAHNKSNRKDFKKSRGTSDGRGNFSSRKGRRADNCNTNDWRKRRDDDRASGFKSDHWQHHGKKKGRSNQRENNENKEAPTNSNSNEGNLEGSKGQEVKIKSEPTNEEVKIKPESTNNDNIAFIKQEKADQEYSISNMEDYSESKVISSTNLQQQNKSSPSKKHAREEDGGIEQGPGKKVDTKNHVSVNA